MSEQEHNKIVVVDETDNPIGVMSYEDAVASNAIRRASRVFVFNEKNEFLLQRRSRHISKPLLLDQSAAGHVDEGEEYIDAAHRELNEELGIEGCELKLVAPSFRETSFFSNIYVAKVPSSTKVITNEYETEEWFWIAISELEVKILNDPDEFSPSFLAVWSELRDRITSNI